MPPVAHVLRRSRTIVAAVVVLAVIVLAACAGIAHAAMAPISFRGADLIARAGTSQPVIASAAGNRITAAWIYRASGPDGLEVSDLRRGSWVRPHLLLGSTDAEHPAIAMAPHGATIVAWQVEHGNPHDGMVGFSYRPAGGAFGPARFVGSTNGDASNVDIALAVNDAGHAIVAWTHSSTERSVQAVHVMLGMPGEVQTVEAAASGASVAVDAASNAILLYGQGENQVHQALAGSSGVFGSPTTIDPNGPTENDVDNNLRVRSNADGRVVAGWGDHCEDAESDCPNVFFNDMGLGTTTTGITVVQRVSNPASAGSDMTGPTRKAGGVTEVGVDDAGNAVLVWDASDSSIAGYDLWSAVAPAGSMAAGTSTSFGTSTAAVASDLRLQVVDGHAYVAWVDSPAPGQNALAYFSEADVSAGLAGVAWPTAKVVSKVDRDADSPGLAVSSGGLAGLVYRIDSDRVVADTNAPRDTTAPRPGLPANRSKAIVRNGAFTVRVACPASEATCDGTIVAKLRVPARRHGLTRVITAGTGTFTTIGGHVVLAKVRLTRAAKLQLARQRSLSLTLTIRTVDAAHNARTLSRAIRVSLPPARR
jgi:hypothetical protein